MSNNFCSFRVIKTVYQEVMVYMPKVISMKKSYLMEKPMYKSLFSHFFFRLALGVFLLTIVSTGSAQCNDLAEGAESFIGSMANTAIIRLTDGKISRSERKERMREFMDEYFFVPGIAQWVLGRFWRKASENERLEYVSLFEDLMVESYVDRFASYSGETLTILRTDIRNKSDVIVSCSILRPKSTDSIQVDWRVRAHGDSYKIIDIMVISFFI